MGLLLTCHGRTEKSKKPQNRKGRVYRSRLTQKTGTQEISVHFIDCVSPACGLTWQEGMRAPILIVCLPCRRSDWYSKWQREESSWARRGIILRHAAERFFVFVDPGRRARAEGRGNKTGTICSL